MTGKSVQEYVNYMTPDHAFGDDIMIIAMCLDFNASITVFIQGRTTIESVTYSPSNPIDDQVTHEVKHSCPHYNCIVESLPVDDIDPTLVMFSSKADTKSTKRKSKAAEPVNYKKQKTVNGTPAAKKQPSRAAQQNSNPIISQDSNVVVPKESIKKTTTPKPDSIKKQKPKKEKKKSPIHGLVGCRSQKCQDQLRKQFSDKEWTKAKVITRYWNRDVNSTLNMLKCVYYMKNNNGSRPPYMTRPTTIVSLGASCSSGGVSASDHTSL